MMRTRLSQLRQSLGYASARDFARDVGLSERYIENIEQGRQIPGKKAAWKISCFLAERIPEVDARRFCADLLFDTDPLFAAGTSTP